MQPVAEDAHQMAATVLASLAEADGSPAAEELAGLLHKPNMKVGRYHGNQNINCWCRSKGA